MTETEQRDLIDRYIAAYNRFDVDGMLALLTDDVHFENVASGQVTVSTSGIAEFRALAQHGASLFSEREQRVVDVTYREDSAVVTIAYRGVLAADIPGGPVAGTVLELTGESEFLFVGNRLARIVDRS